MKKYAPRQSKKGFSPAGEPAAVRQNKVVQRNTFSVPDDHGIEKFDLTPLDQNASIHASDHVSGPNITGERALSGFGMKEKKSQRLWNTQVKFGPASGFNEASSMIAHPVGPDHALGSTPSDSFSKARRDVLKELTNQQEYICGHLLSEKLGGPGERYNLTAIPGSANIRHQLDVENPIKELVNIEGKFVHYSLVVEYDFKPLSAINGNYQSILAGISDTWNKQNDGKDFLDDPAIPFATKFKATWHEFDQYGKAKDGKSRSVLMKEPKSSKMGTNPARAEKGFYGESGGASAVAERSNHFHALWKPNIPTGESSRPYEAGIVQFPYAQKNKNQQAVISHYQNSINNVEPFAAELEVPKLHSELKKYLHRKVFGKQKRLAEKLVEDYLTETVLYPGTVPDNKIHIDRLIGEVSGFESLRNHEARSLPSPPNWLDLGQWELWNRLVSPVKTEINQISPEHWSGFEISAAIIRKKVHQVAKLYKKEQTEFFDHLNAKHEEREERRIQIKKEKEQQLAKKKKREMEELDSMVDLRGTGVQKEVLGNNTISNETTKVGRVQSDYISTGSRGKLYPGEQAGANSGSARKTKKNRKRKRGMTPEFKLMERRIFEERVEGHVNCGRKYNKDFDNHELWNSTEQNQHSGYKYDRYDRDDCYNDIRARRGSHGRDWDLKDKNSRSDQIKSDYVLNRNYSPERQKKGSYQEKKRRYNKEEDDRTIDYRKKYDPNQRFY